jgi:CheY-like chemotaxis protein
MPSVYFAHDQQESPSPRRLALELAGYEVRCFSNGVALCEALAQALPDVLVMDVLLEGRNGFDTCRTLRTKYKAASLPVILSTPIYRSRAYKEEAEAAGAQHYLLRPCQPEELVYLVNQLVSGGSGSRHDRAA